ncbi:fumarate reductase subunit C, partial [Escherichia coli]|nr:fumarate reductase subunit C [Escherichia coli]
NPIVMLINIVTLIATVFHSATWFKLAPKAVVIVVKDEKMPQEPIVRGFWGVTIVVTAAILAVALI